MTYAENDIPTENQLKALRAMINRPMPTDPYTPEEAQKILKEKQEQRTTNPPA